MFHSLTFVASLSPSCVSRQWCYHNGQLLRSPTLSAENPPQASCLWWPKYVQYEGRRKMQTSLSNCHLHHTQGSWCATTSIHVLFISVWRHLPVFLRFKLLYYVSIGAALLPRPSLHTYISRNFLQGVIETWNACVCMCKWVHCVQLPYHSICN